MALRYYASIVTGALAEILAMAGLWGFTELELQDIIFLSLLAFWGGMMAVITVTEREEERT